MRGIKGFEIEEDKGTREITATIESDIYHVLIWIKNSERNTNDCNYTHLNQGMQTFKTEPNTPYIICAARIISHEEITVPPLNCRAYTTLPIPEHLPLILMKHKDITLAISCFALLVIVIVSGVISYKVVLYNPILLKGNKRVIVVNENPPQNVENDSPRSSQSTCSTISTGEGSYVTLVERTNVEQIACSFIEICDIPSDCKTETAVVFFRQREPPPLSLHRMSYASDTSCDTAPNSETICMTIPQQYDSNRRTAK
jgi:hypothetical protein